jgi:SAM-dependent methyltransferase
MHPAETAAHYDQIARHWQENTPRDYGVAQLHRALKFAAKNGAALDIGCGSQGRFIDILLEHGFNAEGLDISTEMIVLAQQQSPDATFHTGDICQWPLPKQYEFICAWDSTFHLPLNQQQPVLQKLCAGLAPQGVVLFTCGGGPAGEISGSFEGQNFDYSTLGAEEFVRLLTQYGCFCRHVEYDQWPEQHVYIIAQKA